MGIALLETPCEAPFHLITFRYHALRGFSGDSAIKNLSAVQNMQVQSLVWEDPLEAGMATHSSILAWRIPWTEEPVGLLSIESQRVR